MLGWKDYFKQAWDITQQGGELQKKYMDAISTSPLNSPEYNWIREYLTNMYKTTGSELYRDLASRGIEGGAFESAIMKLDENQKKMMLQALNNIASGRVQQWGGAGEAGMQTGAQAFKSLLGAANLMEQKQARESAEDMQKKQMFLGGLSKLGQPYGGGFGGCCFMFIMGEGKIIDQVQKFKHDTFGYNSDVANGYRWMSLKLMPLIRRHKSAKKLIRFFITQPLSKFAVHYYNKSPKLYIYAPIGLFWCGLWDMIGRLSAYNSEAYQEMVNGIS